MNTNLMLSMALVWTNHYGQPSGFTNMAVVVTGTETNHYYSLQSTDNLTNWPVSYCVGPGGPVFQGDVCVTIQGALPQQEFFRVEDLGTNEPPSSY